MIIRSRECCLRTPLYGLDDTERFEFDHISTRRLHIETDGSDGWAELGACTSAVAECSMITSPAGAVAKYCDEQVSVCVCLSVCPRAYLRSPHARSLAIFLCMLPMAVARSSSGRVTKSQREGAVLGVSFPLTLHCNAFAAKGSFHIGQEEGDGSTGRAKCDLRLPCCALESYVLP